MGRLFALKGAFRASVLEQNELRRPIPGEKPRDSWAGVHGGACGHTSDFQLFEFFPAALAVALQSRHMSTRAALTGVLFFGMAFIAALVCPPLYPIDAAEPAMRPVVETLPASRGGQDLISKPLPPLKFARWLNTPDNKPLDTAGSVVLYRWWTDTCPYCVATLPAIEKLRSAYGPKGLRIVAVYHPKPPREVEDQLVLDAARQIGYNGPIAVDADWSQLRRAWLAGGRRAATSVTLLVDRHGIIRFVHPGTMYFPSDKPGDAQEDADYHLLDKAIQALVAEQPGK